jgi:hypothetical protein
LVPARAAPRKADVCHGSSKLTNATCQSLGNILAHLSVKVRSTALVVGGPVSANCRAVSAATGQPFGAVEGRARRRAQRADRGAALGGFSTQRKRGIGVAQLFPQGHSSVILSLALPVILRATFLVPSQEGLKHETRYLAAAIPHWYDHYGGRRVATHEGLKAGSGCLPRLVKASATKQFGTAPRTRAAKPLQNPYGVSPKSLPKRGQDVAHISPDYPASRIPHLRDIEEAGRPGLPPLSCGKSRPKAKRASHHFQRKARSVRQTWRRRAPRLRAETAFRPSFKPATFKRAVQRLSRTWFAADCPAKLMA